MNVGTSRVAFVPFPAARAFSVPEKQALIKNEARTLLWRQTIGDGEAAVVKMYRRRGWMDWQRERLCAYRVQREYEALCLLESAGIPCSAPLLWGFGAAAAHGRFEILVTREIAGTVSLSEAYALGAASLSVDDLLSLFAAVREMHRCGVYHGALSPKNILVASPGRGNTFHVIDLARAICFPADIFGTSMARMDLLSLLRRLLQLRGGTGCEKFLREYGLTEKEVGRVMGRLRWFRPTRHTRNWLALRFRVRAAVARLTA